MQDDKVPLLEALHSMTRMTSIIELLRGCKAWHAGHGE